MKKKALDSQRLKALFPETPPAFTALVEKSLIDLKAGKETPVMKKKLSLGLALAIALSLILATFAVAAILSPTAEIFGFLYGGEKQELLQKGDIATLAQVHTAGDLEITLEDVIYQVEGDMTGLYGTGIIAAKEGSLLVLVPEDYSPASPAGYSLHYGKEEEVPEDTPSYLELAVKNGGKLLQVRVRVNVLSAEGIQPNVDVGINHLPLPDGRVRFAFEIMGPTLQRATEYSLRMELGSRQLDAQGEPTGEFARDTWDVQVTPQLSETAKAEIAAQTPAPPPTIAPTAAAGAVMMVGSHWSEHERYMAACPECAAHDIPLKYGEQYDYIKNPENDWDVGFFFLEDGDLESLIKAGLVEDLSCNKTIMSGYGDLYPRIREALTKDGKVYALPYAVFPGKNPMAAIGEEKWRQLGWNFSKAPKTFAELCALAEEYMELPLKTRRGTRLLGDGDTAAASRRLLLSELINLAYTEAMAGGDASQIDTPAFRDALKQIQSAYQALSRKQASTDEKGQIYGLIWDAGQSYLDNPVGKQLRLSLGAKPAFAQRLGVAVVNAHSKNKAAAIQYMKWLSANISAQFLPELNAVITAREIALISLEQSILHYQTASRIEAGITEEDKEYVEELKSRLASGDYGRYDVPEDVLLRFRAEVAPNVTIMTRPLPVTYDIRNDYLSGKMDENAFIRALEEAAK